MHGPDLLAEGAVDFHFPLQWIYSLLCMHLYDGKADWSGDMNKAAGQLDNPAFFSAVSITLKA